MSNEKCFIKDKGNKTNTIPDENTKYSCRVSLQIQSVCYSMEDKYILNDDNDDIRYYPQVLIEQCGYRPFPKNILIDPDLKFTDSEPDYRD